MMYHLRRKPLQRKRRLLACACCRRIWHMLVDARSRAAVEVAEQYADGLVSREQLDAAHEQAKRADLDLNAVMTQVPREELEPHWKRWKGAISAKHASATKGTGRAIDHASDAVWVDLDHARQERASQADLVRDIFGNPFQPVTVDLRWITSNVVDLARTVYDECAFDRLPILADALMDAGCADEQILSHCRSGGPHVRGCWVLDLILGKG